MYYDWVMEPVSNTLGISMNMINIAFGVIVGLIAAVFVFILWSYRDRLKDAKAMLLVLALLSMLPMGAMLVQQRTNLLPKASEELRIVAVEVKNEVKGGAVVYVTLSEPAFAYLGYKDESGKSKVIMGVGKVEMRYGHAFEIEDVNSVPAELTVFVNGAETDRVVKLR